MDRTERIKKMEKRLVRSERAIRALNRALDGYIKAADDIRALSEYYESDDWKSDFAADEAGQLPNDLKRGVLSEDGIYNLLSDDKALIETIAEIVSSHK